MKIQPIILAAGKGTRMGNPDLPKVLTPLNGRPIISYLLESIEKAGFLPPALVVGFHQELVRQELGDAYTYIVQEQQLGTGHAVKSCRSALEGTADAFIIIYGDQPLWTAQTMSRLVEEHEKSGGNLSLVTLMTDRAGFVDFGRIIRDDEGKVIANREYKDCTEEEKQIQEYNPSMYCASDAWLWNALDKLSTENVQKEYYLTELLEIAVKEGERVADVQTTDPVEALGANTPEQLAEVARYV
jgi:bifunctional UDP-N-acetylglucosamine pyrophosphorylase/glucosamine-1-phosphate N-acetyltransferase